jgi:hypothetical protein
MRSTLMFLYLLALVVVQIGTRWAIQSGHWGGPVGDFEPFLFFAINAPTFLLGLSRSELEGAKLSWSSLPCCLMMALVMAIVMANFFQAASLSGGHWQQWYGELHVLSAQALWLAVPTWWTLHRLDR